MKSLSLIRYIIKMAFPLASHVWRHILDVPNICMWQTHATQCTQLLA